MNGFLLDTNVVSELIKKKPHPGVMKWVEAADEDSLYLSVLTLGELRKGIAHKRRTDPAAAAAHRYGRLPGTELAGVLLRAPTADTRIPARGARLRASLTTAAGSPRPALRCMDSRCNYAAR